jgi:uncharacterized coiled-coil DUF342 family protein
MKKSELQWQLAEARQQNSALTERVRDLRAANTEMVNNFTAEAAQLRYERTAALEEVADLKEQVHYWQSVAQGWIRIAREVGDMLTEAVAEATALHDLVEDGLHAEERLYKENLRLRNGEKA